MPVFNAHGAVAGSAEFVRARIGHCTASRMRDVLDFRKDGKPGAARIKYMQELVAERLCDAAMDHFVSSDMEWGLTTEPEAKHAYAVRTRQRLVDGEFTPHPTIEFFGATPDSLIGTDGLAEFKCPRTTTFVGWKLAGGIPDDHVPQMLAQLACTGRKWNDFVAYDPRIKDEGARILIGRLVPTEEQIAKIEAAARQFLADVDAMFEQVTT